MKSPHRYWRRHAPHIVPREKGTTLIEALITIVVLSIGLLGMAGLQANALKLNQTSMQRSHATQLAYAILDHMRADSTAAKAGGYDIALTGEPVEGSALGDWRDEISRSLGNAASGSICRVTTPDATDCNGGHFFRVTLQWNETSITNKEGTTIAGGQQMLTVVGRL